MTINKLKKGACILISGVLIGTVFTGCSKKDTLNKEQSFNSYGYLDNVYVIKYEDINGIEKHAVTYLEENTLYGWIRLYNIYKEVPLIDRCESKDIAFETLGNEIGTYKGNDLFIKYLTTEYGFKEVYTKSEIDSIINGIDNYNIHNDINNKISNIKEKYNS